MPWALPLENLSRRRLKDLVANLGGFHPLSVSAGSLSRRPLLQGPGCPAHLTAASSCIQSPPCHGGSIKRNTLGYFKWLPSNSKTTYPDRILWRAQTGTEAEILNRSFLSQSLKLESPGPCTRGVTLPGPHASRMLRPLLS